MPRPRLDKREILLIGLPTLAVMGGAAFLSRQQFLREQDARGPYRADIFQVEVLPVSPFQAWQGFDTKIVVHVRDIGQLNAPAGAQIYPIKRLKQQVELVGQVNGISQTLALSSQDMGSGYEPQHPGALRAVPVQNGEGEHHNVHAFLAKTSGFDPGSTLQLRGKIWIERRGHASTSISSLPPGWSQEKGAAEVRLLARTKEASLSQTLERATSVSVVRNPPTIQEVQAELLSPVYAHTNVVGDNGSGIVHVFFPRGALANKLPLLRATAAQVFDAQGRAVVLKDDRGKQTYKMVSWDLNASSPAVTVRLPLERVPLERGALKMKLWFAFDDGWPASVETEVRPAWMSKRARTLQLQDVHTEGGNVVVTARYTGTAPLRFQGGLIAGQTKPLLFDERNDANIIFVPGVPYKRLFTHWSQHYTLPDGKSYWFPNAVSVQSVSHDSANSWRIIYKTNALQALKPGQSAHFFAQVGVQGDGFVPVEATVTRPKKLRD